ncbi:hypothetical protein NRY68_14960 [Acidithiobacillus ferrooxidans]|uniref:ParE family toxin-like protein n=1 Tax=Acidithiobacillus ferrooxidans TaxID=920 RepID=UPI00214935DF|nr:hypothetical protein [Acidithiobacillus ferrooxidans]MCR1347058.1 hypothetical protein [Acidithiobacillus ferrooxidans]MCR1355878.1 hypothetical protein [Acidithiobacillus ferrooxidans]
MDDVPIALEEKENADMPVADPVDLSCIQSPAMATKARRIIQAVTSGESPYTAFRGKRLICNRTIISIPLNDNYRILFRELPGGAKEPIKACTHETYNTKKPK